ncbi:MAG: hypothetical protein E7166_01505 [Firmicutes bacterium]|nr:hypothetical protein [Bacillota bacterium]
MYKDDIKELYSQKRESLTLFLVNSFTILLKLYVFMPKSIKERDKLRQIIKSYIKYNNEEKEILRIVKKKYGRKESIDSIDLILNDLDKLFVTIYNNYECIIGDFEDMIVTKDLHRTIIPKDKILNLTLEQKRKYINELGGK